MRSSREKTRFWNCKSRFWFTKLNMGGGGKLKAEIIWRENLGTVCFPV